MCRPPDPADANEGVFYRLVLVPQTEVNTVRDTLYILIKWRIILSKIWSGYYHPC